MESKVYQLPKVFARDHWDRDCGRTDEVVRETADHFFVKMTPEGWSDMESDADYYVECGPDMGPDYFGLVASARATLKALHKQGAPAWN